MTQTMTQASLTDAQRALAAWESATVQTLNPLLSSAQADALWLAILANRAAPNAATFSVAVALATEDPSARVRAAAQSAIDNLTTLLAPAASAAHAE